MNFHDSFFFLIYWPKGPKFTDMAFLLLLKSWKNNQSQMSKRLTNLTINKNLNLKSTFEITALSRHTVKTQYYKGFSGF